MIPFLDAGTKREFLGFTYTSNHPTTPLLGKLLLRQLVPKKTNNSPADDLNHDG